jgi:hypothetical protein
MKRYETKTAETHEYSTLYSAHDTTALARFGFLGKEYRLFVLVSWPFLSKTERFRVHSHYTARHGKARHDTTRQNPARIHIYLQFTE